MQVIDDVRVKAPVGVVRAYDVQTGKLRWTWNPIPTDKSDPASRTWLNSSAARTGAANVWAMMSYDRVRGLIYLPVSSASNDFYGGSRPGNNLYTDSLVCLHVNTGELKWSFQVVHHDLWDYDIPAQPVLFDFKRSGKIIPAVAIVTKMGRMFLFNRDNGTPVFPIKEVAVPKSHVPGEWTSPTQPLQVLPPPLVPQSFTEKDIWGRDPEELVVTKKTLSSVLKGPIYTPPSIQGTVEYPGPYGGCNWAGASFDKSSGLIITTTNKFPFLIQLVPRLKSPAEGTYPMDGTPYWAKLNEIMGPGEVPLIKPPWGTIVAVDPVTGKIRWQRPVGYIPEASNVKGYKNLGSPSVGGVITTASNLTFISGTRDQHLRVYQSSTGRELAAFPLPYVGGSLPIIYSVKGKEYVLVCSGGHGFLNAPLGDHVIAFALDENTR